MNIFKDQEGILLEPSYTSIQESMDRFWNLAKEIVGDLGPKGYYLDEYLSIIFETLSKVDLIALSDIINEICRSIFYDCRIVCGMKNKEKSEFYDIIKNYIDEHPLNYEHDYTKFEFYTANILMNNLGTFSQKYKLFLEERFLSDIDYILSNEIYDKISYIIGEKRMEQFNETICEAFIFCPIIVTVTQQIAIRGIQMLTYRDPETSKKIYRIMVEGNL